MTSLNGGYYMKTFKSMDFFALLEILEIEIQRLPEEYGVCVMKSAVTVGWSDEPTATERTNQPIFGLDILIRKPHGNPIPDHIFDCYGK